MKTAISVPDETYSEVERHAQSLGVSRSEFYTRAARFYLDHLDRQSLTEEINAALAVAGADDSAGVAVRAGRERLAAAEW
ncbi:ribbon-helix-helix protein, CopG family [Actinokineospora enzanensis]|uniref:ribbon-helix-helix protein, CopG family n=1 Tax=Actinokineospora enzanensis TaxID=155975 RepID=UPI00038171C2|nr:ribbon-helix-helix protein, CopG family [Actinokineospora enzanensis]